MGARAVGDGPRSSCADRSRAAPRSERCSRRWDSRPGGSQWLVVRSLILDRGWPTQHWRHPLRGDTHPSRSEVFRAAMAKATLDEVVAGARTRADVIRELGFRPDGTTYRLLRAELEEQGISAAHFEAPHAAMRQAPRRRSRRPLAEILVEGSTYTNVGFLKWRLVSSGLLDPRCHACGLTTWLGLPLVLHLDHLHGRRDDHRIANLRLLCPNCHSQTDTYAGRNIGRYEDTLHDAQPG